MEIKGLGTPYELDLEVKDRKPILTPCIGDLVKIKSIDWYRKWKDERGCVEVGWLFTPYMAKYCNLLLEVSEVTFSGYKLKGAPDYTFTLKMFEDVFPKGPALNKLEIDPAITFKNIPLSSPFTTLGGPWSLYVDNGSSTQSSTKKKLKIIQPTRLIKIKKL